MNSKFYKDARLTQDNDLSKTEESAQVITDMANGLANGENDMGKYFHSDFRWIAKRGYGEKKGIEEFRNN